MEFFSKFVCTNCQEDIPGIRVHCESCVDAYDSCLSCFSAGAEIGQHRNNHAYKLMDSGILSIFRGKNSFSSKENLFLLDAIEQFGFGNWQDISKHIETKSPEDAKEEYISKFLNGTIGRLTWGPQFENRPVLKDHTHQNDTSTLKMPVLDKMPPLDILPEEAQQLGYLANREDFEIEYDAGAEKMVSNLSFTQEDDECDLALKLAHIQMYSRRLKERARRKKLVRDYQLAAQYFREGRRAKTREAKEFREKFRVFAQFFSSPQYDRLLYSLEEERGLRHRLAQLLRYRTAGLTKIDDCIYWEQQTLLQQRAVAFTAQKAKIPTNTERLAFLNQLKDNNYKFSSSQSAEVQQQLQQQASLPPDTNSKELTQLQDVATQMRRNLLLNNEMQLCSVTSTPVTSYITMKTIMLSDKRQPTNASEKVMKSYFSKCGWLQ